MAEVVGAPIDLKVCENCPRRDRGRDLRASGAGRTDVVVSERGVFGVYIQSDGRSAGRFEEHSTAIYMDDSEGFDAFANCEEPVKNSFLQRMGITAPTCPALEALVGGNPADGNIIAEYVERQTPNTVNA